jgi:hypothetical protein
MKRVIRPAYPAQFSIGLLLLIFATSFFLSAQIFEGLPAAVREGTRAYFGMFLVSSAATLMVLILWEEFLFPIKIIPTEAGVVFRNHRNKLKTQVIIYSLIPAIYVFIYFFYEVNQVRYFMWAAVNIIVPFAGKLSSGIKNYNDFLKLTNEIIEFRNNEKLGKFQVSEVKYITLVRDERNVLHSILVGVDNREVEINIDEMELDAYCTTIDSYIRTHYGSRVRASGSAG